MDLHPYDTIHHDITRHNKDEKFNKIKREDKDRCWVVPRRRMYTCWIATWVYAHLPTSFKFSKN